MTYFVEAKGAFDESGGGKNLLVLHQISEYDQHVLVFHEHEFVLESGLNLALVNNLDVEHEGVFIKLEHLVILLSQNYFPNQYGVQVVLRDDLSQVFFVYSLNDHYHWLFQINWVVLLLESEGVRSEEGNGLGDREIQHFIKP